MQDNNVSQEKVQPRNKGLFAIKIISIVAVVAVTAFLVITYLDLFNTSNPQLSFAVWFTILYLIIGGAGYLVCTIISIVGIVIAKRTCLESKGQLIYFILLAVIPIVLWVLGILVLPKTI